MSASLRGGIVSPQCLTIVRLFICISLLSATDSLFAQSSSAGSRQPERAAVSRLRRALQRSYPSPTERDRAIKQCLAELRTLADWQAAVTLTEWHESFRESEEAAVDRANHAAANEWFTTSVHRILHQDDPASAAGTMEMIGRMAEQARVSGEPLTLVRSFTGDLAESVTQGPPRLRGLAARTLAQIEPPASIAVPALTVLLRNEDAPLRLAAADSFALLIRNSLNAAGESALDCHPSWRRDLVLAASTVLSAIHAGLDDPCPEVRHRCLEIIGLASAALSRLIDEPSGNGESSARRPLQAEYEELRPLLLALHDQAPTLEHFLHHDDPETRILTHKALEEMGIARGRWLCRCTALGQQADEKLLGELLHEAVPRLSEELVHPDVRVRRSALDVLEMSGSLALPALPALTHALHDPDRFVRWSAVRTVGKLGPPAGPRTRDDLTRLLNDPDAELRKAAAHALEQQQAQTAPRP
jgi:HEAT repeat protein